MQFRTWYEGLALAGNYKLQPFQRLAAAAYMVAPLKEPEAMEGFRDLMRKISRQAQFLRHDFNFVPSSTDSYKSMKQLRQHVQGQRAQGQRRADMYVYAEPPGPEGAPVLQGHPELTNDENVMLRGVHDAIAHLMGGHPFSARGEYGAYTRHLKTLCNVAQVKQGQCPAAKVLFTEIVGQTSYYYIYKNFPPQKAVIMRDFDHYNVGALAPDSPLNEFFALQGKQLVPRPGADSNRFRQLPVGAEYMRQESLLKAGTPAGSATASSP